MRRRSFRKAPITLSLFPFLAVLVCTMGALIVLLVTVVQKAKVDADSVSPPAAAAPLPAGTSEHYAQKEIHDWRRQVLQKQREELLHQLADHRLALSHLEDHVRRLEEKWQQAKTQFEEASKLGQARAEDQQAITEQLEQIRTQLAAARQEFDDARQKAARVKRQFAIIPYDGPNGTRRRPIYVECTDEGIVLQPEGVLLKPQDFEGSLGPGNPLDAALRTAREFMASLGDTQRHGEPYPLLVVRPNGTVAYAVARAAIQSWDDEFGYELIDKDMELAYPPADPRLRSELERAIADARSRQAILAMAMPGRFKPSRGASGLVATTNGGFRSVGGDGFTGSLGTGDAHGGGFTSVFHQASTSPGTEGGLGMSAGGTGTSPSAMSSTNGDSAGAAGAGNAAAGQASAGQGSSSSSAGFGQRTPSGAPGGNAATGSAAGSRGSSNSHSFGQPSSSNAAGSHSDSATGGNIGTYQLGQKAPAGNVKPLSASRGNNWGLPNRGQAATGFTRSIPMQCLADRLVILPDPGDYRDPVVIPLANPTSAAIDSLVSAVWKRTESWGIAGENGYWKPVLRIQVAPDAEQRFAELNTLMDGSGLVVERK